MLLTNHTLTGIGLGLTIDDPVVLAPTAVASHFILDSVPHFMHPSINFMQPAGKIFAFFDCLVSLSLALAATIVWPHRIVQLFIGVVGATGPDLLYVPYYLMKIRFWEPLFRFHGMIQTERWYLLPVEMIWASVMIVVIRANL